MNAIARLTACALILGTTQLASAVTLQNDGFTEGMTAGYQGGFSAGEEAAAELTPASGTWKVDRVRFLYGTDTTTRTITLKIYAASANATPAGVLYSGDFQVTGSADAMVEIDLTALSVVVSSAFRVSIAFQDAGNPSVARDDDGLSDANLNLLKSLALGWTTAQTLGVQGDWVIRADVTQQGGGGTPDAGPNDPDAMPGGPNPGDPDAGASVSCTLNSDCALGSYCGDDSTCAVDCRTDVECMGDMSCQPALGRCEAKSSGGGGCSTGGSSPVGSGGAGLLLLGLLALRRRSRRS